MNLFGNAEIHGLPLDIAVRLRFGHAQILHEQAFGTVDAAQGIYAVQELGILPAQIVVCGKSSLCHRHGAQQTEAGNGLGQQTDPGSNAAIQQLCTPFFLGKEDGLPNTPPQKFTDKFQAQCIGQGSIHNAEVKTLLQENALPLCAAGCDSAVCLCKDALCQPGTNLGRQGGMNRLIKEFQGEQAALWRDLLSRKKPVK